jgi:large subunit ribosomal protein L30
LADKLKITLYRSPIGYEQSQRETARSLGFKKLQQTVVHEDNAVVRGMIHKIQHMVRVETIQEAAKPKAKK